jgi:hypothetical protein
LFPLIAAAQQQNTSPPQSSIVDSVTWAPIDAEFKNTFSQTLTISKIASGEAIDSNGNSRLSPSVSEARQPVVEDIFPG